MEVVTGNRQLAHLAGTLGVVGQLAGAYVFLLYPALSVPSPANYGFFVVWFVLVSLTLAWWRQHPWRSFLVPIVSVPIAWVLLMIGFEFLGWRP
jgi:hypothetical protein